MTRIATSASARTGAGAAAAGSGARRTASAVLTLQAGDSIPGNVMPFQGLAFYLVNQDPAAALAKNGFAGPSPIQAWLQACRTSRDRCQAGAKAMSAGAVAAGQTNAAGAAVMPPVPPGHYYVFGHVPYHGRELIWHRSVELQPGPNGDFLDQTNGTVG